jgi:hypothetical protein
MQNSTPIPEGYWQDAKGCLVPENMIKPIDKERDHWCRAGTPGAHGVRHPRPLQGSGIW